MKRGDFLGTAAGLTALQHVPAGQGRSETATAPTAELNGSSSRLRAHWLRNGLIQAEGWHESYTFVVRRGGQRLDAAQQYKHAESEDVIRQLKQQGVECFEMHFYKGFGIEAEKEGTKRIADIVHRYGMKLSTYIQWNTMIYETVFAEEPKAKNWIQRDIAGLPILLTYGYQQSFRYRPSFSCQEYLDYLKRVVKLAIEWVKTDFIDFDNFDLYPEPDSCHCEVCIAGFRTYLKTKYSPSERRDRFPRSLDRK